MASVNKWIGIGNLGADPETRYAPNGDAICNIRIACTESWRDKATGEKKETTEWVRVVFFGKVAEIADKYLKKGSPVYIEGRLQTRKWQDKEGRDQYTTEIRADQLQMLGGKPEGQGGGQQQSSRPARNDPPAPRQQPAPSNSGGGGGNFGDFDDDIPFATNHIGADPAFKKLKLHKD